MKNSKLNDLSQKLSILKHFTWVITPLAITIVGVVVFVPCCSMNKKLRAEINSESVARGRKVKSLVNDVVSSRQWEEQRQYQAALATDANQISIFARHSTQRPVLSYKIFPEPKDKSRMIFDEYGQRYRGGLEGMLAGINARECPTQTEIDWLLRGTVSSGSGRSRRKNRRNVGEVETTIVEDLCMSKAKSAFVYANPANFSGYDFWEEYEYTSQDNAVKDCWYWQLAYWIIEDVVETVKTLNDGSSTVFESPVKRIMSVNFIGSGKKLKGRMRGGGRSRRNKKQRGMGITPGYVLLPGEGLVKSLTGRVCDKDIDIVHFNVSVLAGSKAILLFEKELCSAKKHNFNAFSGKGSERTYEHNQITILEHSITPVNPEDEEHDFYRYGDEDAVVKLDLICEYIFNKSGYEEIKPEQIKEMLNPHGEESK